MSIFGLESTVRMLDRQTGRGRLLADLEKERQRGSDQPLDLHELDQYRRGVILPAMREADALLRQARIRGDRLAEARALNLIDALRRKSNDIYEATRHRPTAEEYEASIQRLRDQFPIALAGIRRQIKSEQDFLTRRLAHAPGEPYGERVIPGYIRRFEENQQKLADLAERERRGLTFAPYTPTAPDPALLARLADEQRRRVGARRTADYISQAEQMAAINEALARFGKTAEDAESAATGLSGAESRWRIDRATAPYTERTAQVHAESGEHIARVQADTDVLTALRNRLAAEMSHLETEGQLRDLTAAQRAIAHGQAIAPAREKFRTASDIADRFQYLLEGGEPSLNKPSQFRVFERKDDGTTTTRQAYGSDLLNDIEEYVNVDLNSLPDDERRRQAKRIMEALRNRVGASFRYRKGPGRTFARNVGYIATIGAPGDRQAGARFVEQLMFGEDLFVRRLRAVYDALQKAALPPP